MYSLFPVLALLATANAAAIDRSGSQDAALEKRCVLGFNIFGTCKDAPAATTVATTAAAITTTAVNSTSTSTKATVTTSSTSTVIVPTTTTAAGNVVNTVASVGASIINCPLGVLVNGACSSTAAAATTTAATTTAKATTAATTTTAAAGNVVSSIVNPVVSAASSVVAPVVNPVASAASSVVAPVVNPVASAASSVVAPVVNPVASAASSVVAPVVSAASSVVAPVVSAASSVVAPVASAASSVVAPVASAASSVVAPVASAASSVVAPVVSAASSVVAPVASAVSSIIAPASSSVSSIISSVSASSAAASASSSAVSSSSVAPTTTSTSTTPSASATPVNPTVSGWAYQAVVAEGTGGRALTGSTYAGSSMTVESCLAFCDNAGFPLAGLEYSSECYCGSSLSNGASLTKTATGGMACSGNPNELCGGSSALSLYRSTKANGAGLNSDLTSMAVALPAGWSSTTCMQEVSGRAFTKKSLASDDMTIQKCLSFCGDSKYAGLEYGRECYCADTLSNGASLSSTSGQCNTPCAGSASTTCGGPSALQVYTNANKQTSSGAYSNTACVQEVDGRLLRGASIAADNMTIETCTNFCQSQGFKIAGLEYGRECYCDNSYFSAPLSSGQCNMNCAGNANENCGGPNALNIFTLGA